VERGKGCVKWEKGEKGGRKEERKDWGLRRISRDEVSSGVGRGGRGRDEGKKKCV